MPIALLGLNTEELRALLQEEGEPAYRGDQLAEWIYRRGARTFEEMTNLPHTLCVQMKKKHEVGRSQVVAVQHSRDGTAKLLVVMRDGERGNRRLALRRPFQLLFIYTTARTRSSPRSARKSNA